MIILYNYNHNYTYNLTQKYLQKCLFIVLDRRNTAMKVFVY